MKDNPNKLADAIAARDAAIQQAQIWKMEAQSANATIAEIYRLVGSKAGNWNGANPVREALAEHDAQAAPAPVQVDEWRSMDSVPRDGTLLRLLVEFDDHATEDAEGPSPTIGANSFDDTGEDVWQFAAWCWTHDHFTEGKGKPVGWLPMLSDSAHPTAPAADGAGELDKDDDESVPPDGFQELLRDYEFAAYEHGKTGENAIAVDAAGSKLRAALAALRQPVPDAVRELPDSWRKYGKAVGNPTYCGCATELESAIAQQESRNGSEGESA